MRVYSKRFIHPPAIYIGRGSPWGNPFPRKAGEKPGSTLTRFLEYAKDRLKKEPNWLEPLRGKDLECFCAGPQGLGVTDPWVCHGQVIMALLEDREVFGG